MGQRGSAVLEWLAGRLRPWPRPTVPAPGRPPGPAGAPCFTADFSSTRQWVAGRSWAYPGGGPTNPGDNKLDHLVTDPEYSRDGVFRATRRPDGDWDTGLLTTEGSADGFTLRTGDVLETRVKLPTGLGAWPAIWTWRDGGNEIDVFEYHPDNPGVLELSNHVRGGGLAYAHPSVRPGAWVALKVEFRARTVVWWVNGIRAFADGTGVGRDWSASLIVNLSVSSGRYHPAPDPVTSALSYQVDFLRVYRSRS